MTVNERVPTPFAAEVLALLQVVQVGLDLRLRQKISRSGNRVAHELTRVTVESLRNTDLEN
ncbi:hypothetical protein Goklo_022866 [Gossypium klotzschianum]|uniref:RNase H type-1 domain-containing protein n=1 Tax=Gossypium klotzschianum TaxID=34286 RepID=A0A7J8TNQ3_9ROSI|nr:hypothetical protein [Gossypium klotzschianum]